MAVKYFLVFVTVFAYVEFLSASPTRRQYIAITEATASDKPVTDDESAWDDNDEFDLDGDGWFSETVVSPSAIPEKTQAFNEYDDDYSQGNMMADFGADVDDDDDDEDDDETLEQEAEEDDVGRNESEFLFVPPKETRLVLEDDDDDQSGLIKVRHTGRSSYPRTTSEGADNSLESLEEDDGKNGNEHSYEFTIDEDKEDEFDDDDDDNSRKEDGEAHDSAETLPRRESPDDDDDDEEEEDEFVSEGEDKDGDMFDNPEENAAQVIYGDHVFLY